MCTGCARSEGRLPTLRFRMLLHTAPSPPALPLGGHSGCRPAGERDRVLWRGVLALLGLVLVFVLQPNERCEIEAAPHIELM